MAWMRGSNASDQRRTEHGIDREQAGQCVGGGVLGAVEQGQAFLRAQHQRGQADFGQCLGSRQALTIDEGLADTDHHAGQVRKRGQVARGANRALARNHRNEIVLQERFQQGQCLRADARGALGEAGQLQRHHQPHDRRRHRLTHAGRVREHDIALQGFQILALDAHAGQLAEAGVDAIHRSALGDDVGHGLRTAQHGGGRSRVQPHPRAVMDRAPLRQRDGAGVQGQGSAHEISRHH